LGALGRDPIVSGLTRPSALRVSEVSGGELQLFGAALRALQARSIVLLLMNATASWMGPTNRAVEALADRWPRRRPARPPCSTQAMTVRQIQRFASRSPWSSPEMTPNQFGALTISDGRLARSALLNPGERGALRSVAPGPARQPAGASVREGGGSCCWWASCSEWLFRQDNAPALIVLFGGGDGAMIAGVSAVAAHAGAAFAGIYLNSLPVGVGGGGLVTGLAVTG